MGVKLEFEGLPAPSLWGAIARRRPGLRGEGSTVPRIEAVARNVRRDAVDYARITGFARPDPVPVTWPQVLAAPVHLAIFAHPAFPLPVAGLVHVAQRIVALRPIAPSETLEIAAHVEGHRVARAGGELDLVTTVRAGGEVVWQGETTILSRAIRGHGGAREPDATPALRPTRSMVIAVPEDLGRRYAVIAGDRNPIHLHALPAKLFGFPRAIAHGMWTLARTLAELDRDVPDACELHARFLAPVLLPSRITIEGGPLSSDPREGHAFIVRGRKPCMTGTITPR